MSSEPTVTRVKGVLRKSDWEKIRRAERALHDVVPIIQAGEECGLDCQARKEQAATLAQFFQDVRTRFPPEDS